jgi:predicted transcriptional regulator
MFDISRGGGKYCSRDCQSAGMGYKALVMAALPATISQLMARISCSPDTIYKMLKRLASNREIHASGVVPSEYEGRKSAGLLAVVYAAGPGNDPEEPANPRAALTYWYRKLMLQAMPCAQKDFPKRIGIDSGTVNRLIHKLHSEGLCHIGYWRKPKQGPPVAVYRRGAGQDVLCTVVYEPKIERDRRTLAARRKKDPERVRDIERSAKIRARVRKKGDPLTNALFGTPQQRKQKATQPHGGSNE